MTRTRELTWTVGSAGRRGRWRKKYRNKVHYFDGGRGKSDQGAYQAALTKWKQIKARIDAEAPSPHHHAYQEAIDQWQEVLACARLHDDHAVGDAAIEVLNRLKQSQKQGSRKPPRREDLFENFFELDVRRPKLAAAFRKVWKTIDEVAFKGTVASESPMAPPDSAGKQISALAERREGVLIRPTQAMFQPDALTVEGIVWNDRLNVMRRRGVNHEQSVKAQVEKYLELKGAKAEAGDITQGRRRKLTIQLNAFVDWIGNLIGVEEITSQKLLEYREHLLLRVRSGEWSASTASDRLVSLKSFIRWLYRTEAISMLPRVMDAGSHELEIGRERSSIETFTKQEIAKLLLDASSRTRLYILLTLNTSMTQKDIADLTFDEVDLNCAVIARKRSKTNKFNSTPCVSYKLWPETLALLKKEMNPRGSGRVLVNAKGIPLWLESYGADGTYRKVDNVRSAFDRLRRKLGIGKSFISLKKTSASELAGSKEYNSVKGLFLGHAPTSIADKHYAQAPVELLNEAVLWLRARFAIQETLELVRGEKYGARS